MDGLVKIYLWLQLMNFAAANVMLRRTQQLRRDQIHGRPHPQGGGARSSRLTLG